MKHLPFEAASSRSRLRWAVGTGIGLLVSAFALYAIYFDRSAADFMSAVALELDDVSIARKLAPELSSIHVLTMDDVAPDERRMISPTPGVGFRFEDDFNTDGRPELVLLGQYEDEGTGKSFVLIATKSETEWTKGALLTFEEDFIVGLKYQKTLTVLYCALCDYGAHIRWTGTDFVAEPTRPHGAAL